MGSQDFHGELIRNMLVKSGLMKSRFDAQALFDSRKFNYAADVVLKKLMYKDNISGNKIGNRDIEETSRLTNGKTDRISEKILSKNASEVIGKLLKNAKTKTTGIDKRSAKANLNIFPEGEISKICEDIVEKQFSDEFVSEFEKEFEDRTAQLDKKTLKKLEGKDLLKKLFSVWMVSLCTIASMPDCSGGEDGLFGLTFTL